MPKELHFATFLQPGDPLEIRGLRRHWRRRWRSLCAREL
jgi:hypothetical protein